MVNLFPLFVLLIGVCKMDTLHLPEDVHTRPFLFSRFSSLWAETLPSAVLGMHNLHGLWYWNESHFRQILLQRATEYKKSHPLPSQVISGTLGKHSKFIIILHLPTLLFSDHSDVLLRDRPLVDSSCLVFWLFPVSKMSFSPNRIVETFSHVGWVSSLFRSCLLSDTDPLNPGSLRCYYWLRL